jgi:hypothetical protein
MFSFLRNAAPHAASVALRQTLIQQGLPFGLSVNTTCVVTSQGTYAGRSMRNFRAFDSQQAARS